MIYASCSSMWIDVIGVLLDDIELQTLVIRKEGGEMKRLLFEMYQQTIGVHYSKLLCN